MSHPIPSSPLRHLPSQLCVARQSGPCMSFMHGMMGMYVGPAGSGPFIVPRISHQRELNTYLSGCPGTQVWTPIPDAAPLGSSTNPGQATQISSLIPQPPTPLPSPGKTSDQPCLPGPNKPRTLDLQTGPPVPAPVSPQVALFRPWRPAWSVAWVCVWIPIRTSENPNRGIQHLNFSVIISWLF